MEQPSEEEVQATADKTRTALEKLPDSQAKTSFIRYTPGQQNGEAENHKDVGGGGGSIGTTKIQTQEDPQRSTEPPSSSAKKSSEKCDSGCTERVDDPALYIQLEE
jgi:hypothetical protein